MLDGSSRFSSWAAEEIETRAHVGAEGAEGWKAADQALQRIARTRSALDLDEATWLVRARRAEVHRHRGFSTFLEYMERVLGYGPRVAMDRLRVAAAVESIPAMRAAMADGMPFSALRELVRVVTPKTAVAWVDAVRGKVLREIERMVAGRREGELPTDAPPLEQPRSVRFEIMPETHALLREAQKALAARAGHFLDDDAIVNAMCRAVLAEVAEIADRREAPQRAPHQICVTTCDVCKRGWQDGGGVTVRMSPEALEVAECDAERIGRVDGGAPARATQDVPPRTRREVFARDHGRCVVPGCRATRNLQLHHIEHRENGGGHQAWNLCLLCSGHHAAHHRGQIAITGRAPELTIKIHGLDRPTASGGWRLVGDEQKAKAALVRLGYKPGVASDAVRQARAHVGTNGGLEALAREALRTARRQVSSEDMPTGEMVRLALVGLGYREGDARGATDRARAHVGIEASFAAWMKEALRVIGT
jgi:hypothetical protein